MSGNTEGKSVKELRQYIVEMQRSLGRIEGTVNAIERDVKEVKNSNNDNHDGFNNRIGKLENDKHWQKGAAAVIALVASYVFSVFKI